MIYDQVLREGAMGHPCRECGAAPQAFCISPRGFAQKSPHQARIDDYIKAKLT